MKILVPVDGSKYSAAAVAFIASRSTLIGGAPEVELLNVQLPVPVRAARVVGQSVLRSYYDDEARKALKPAAAALKKAGLTAMTRHEVGSPGEQIAVRADAERVDLIVMGSHGHGALASAVLGSVTNAVLARCKKPLLMLRERAAPKGDSLKVGIAVDGSKFGRAAVRYVLKHMNLFGAAPQLTLIHVVPDFAGAVMPDMAGIALPAFSAEEIQAMQAKAFDTAVAPVRRLLTKVGVAAAEACLAGTAGDELSAFARKQKLDVLVLGSHGYGAFKRAVLGSVANRVAAHCATPLLLIREA
ncbi:MAG: universal stress protein [Betaproteobacteria bacterium]